MKQFWVKTTIVAMGCAMVLGLSACNKSANLNDYVSVEFDGYDGYGEAKVIFDTNQFEEDFGQMKFKGKDADDYREFYDSAAECIAKEFIDVETKRDEGLSNGDKVSLEWDCDEEAIKELTGYSVKYESTEVEVEGLEDVPEFDAFEDLKIEFSGVDPNGKAVIVTDSLSGGAKELEFELSKDKGLSNGDVVTVKIANETSRKKEKYFIELCGALPKEMEKQYTVEGLDTYVTDLKQISSNTLFDMDMQARVLMERHVLDTWTAEEQLESMTLLGNYFLTEKGEGNLVKNALFFVYKMKVVNTEFPDGYEYYYYTYYPNVAVKSNGAVAFNEESGVMPYGELTSWGDVTGEAFKTEQFWYLGYQDLESLYDTWVTGSASEYDCVSTVEDDSVK